MKKYLSDTDVEIKVGDEFNAYLLEHGGKLAIGCPCTATKTTTHFIWAKDWRFDRTKFTFEHA